MFVTLVDDILIQMVNHFIIHQDICTDSYAVAATEKSSVLHNALGMEFCWKMLCSELVSCMGTIWRRVSDGCQQHGCEISNIHFSMCLFQLYDFQTGKL